MNALYPAPTEVPPALYGTRDRDILMRTMARLATLRLGWAGLVHRRERALAADDLRTPLTITERHSVAHDTDVVSLSLRAAEGGELPRWFPGAHLDLELPSGRVRQYSLCGDPGDTSSYRIAVRRIPGGGGGSVEVHQDLCVGDTVWIRGPRNAFPFVVPGHSGSRSVRAHFVAGGIGITPILPMVRMAQRLGVEWTMVYAGRNRDTLPFLAELTEFGDRVSVRTDDEHGLPTGADLLPGVGPGTAIFCCGPVAMTDTVAAAVRELPDVALHSERFSTPPIVDGKPFQIELARTGTIIDVPADRTALETVLDTRPATPYSCRQGFCRTCVVRVLGGAPDHRDTALTEAERAAGAMLLCISRCDGGRLVLDL
ncbi:PDR/VanB family oxidoreductase [Nocardia cyriacigeorgica]|nr:PDR/VanB family oxidoreductase [Nocardia cyriacigeorgica]